MNRFETELKNNNFVCSECSKCDKIVWPPSEYCSSCLGKVEWRRLSREGILLEYSCRNGEYFCMAEFEGKVRIMGTMRDATGLQIGGKLYLEKCDYDGGEKFVFRMKTA